jgi:dTDP-glucose 4,6-dehydratase
MHEPRRVLVTGGAGFIGTNFVRYLFSTYPGIEITVLDKLTYAGNPENLKEFEGREGYRFLQGDIRDRDRVEEAAKGVDIIYNFAAETHVDRSIGEALDFVRTDVEGTCVLLTHALEAKIPRFVQVSTDEVYGSIETGSFSEGDALEPNSPYAASKAGGDLLVRSFHRTYGLPVLLTRSSNNYGPYQYPEKLIPLFVTNALDGESLPLYGDGLNVRDWIYVEDNCRALDLVGRKGEPGGVYNVGAGEEHTNLEITETILELTGRDRSLIRYVSDRPGHDRRYSLDSSSARALGFEPTVGFGEGLERTVAWYRENRPWWEPIKSGAFKEYYRKMYARRLEEGRTET